MEEPNLFVKSVLTAQNPKDAYYMNFEEQIKYYFGIILVGLMMILIFALS